MPRVLPVQVVSPLAEAGGQVMLSKAFAVSNTTAAMLPAGKPLRVTVHLCPAATPPPASPLIRVAPTGTSWAVHGTPSVVAQGGPGRGGRPATNGGRGLPGAVGEGVNWVRISCTSASA